MSFPLVGLSFRLLSLLVRDRFGIILKKVEATLSGDLHLDAGFIRLRRTRAAMTARSILV